MKPDISLRSFLFCLPMYALGAVVAAGQAGIGWDAQAATDADPAGVLFPIIVALTLCTGLVGVAIGANWPRLFGGKVPA